MENHLRLAGVLLVLLSFIHVFFPRYFKWKTDLSKIAPINRQMMGVHTFFVALTVFMMGLLCLTSAEDLISTSLGKRIALGFAIFWVLRLLIQLFGYSRKLWKGKVFETSIHILFSFLWIYLSIVFIMIYKA